MAMEKQQKDSGYLVSGAVAGAISRTTTAPLDRARVLLQTQTTSSLSLIQGFRQIYTEGGLHGYYVGNGLNLAMCLPESALRFWTFEKCKLLVAEATGKSKRDLGPMETFGAGAAAGAFATTVVYPLEVIKTNLQISLGTSTFDLVRDVYAKGGGRSFYRGLGTSLMGIIPYGGIDLALYETLKRCVGSESDISNMLCGSAASTISTSSVYPLHLVRTRLQAQARADSTHAKYDGLVDCFKKTFKSEGIRGFYKGLVPNVAKVAPAASITYAIYERMKKLYNLQ